MSMDGIRVNVENLSLAFPLMGLRSTLNGLLKKKGTGGAVGGEIEQHDSKLYVHALRDINLTIREGDRIAVTGHNGAGKSTLLRVMAGIYPPTSGEIYTHDEVAALLNPTAGMQQYATGYENIWIRGVLQGMSNNEIENSIADIEEFTELGRYMNLPIERYSRGMRLRLAFAVATCQKPDIVLIDEWVNAGDQEFRGKARERLKAFIGSSGALVLATHSEKVIQTFCDSIVRLEHGRVEWSKKVLRGDGAW